MKGKQNFCDGTIWESKVGYARAVKVGNHIMISGTTAMEGIKVVGLNDVYAQTIFIISKIEKTLQQLNATLTNVVRSRIYVVDISKWEDVSRAHQEYFGAIKPACTMVEVNALIHPDLLIEIEVDAILE